MNLSPRARQLLALVITIICAGGTITIAVTSVGDDGSPPANVTIHIDGPDRDTAKDDTVKVSRQDVAIAEQTTEKALHREDPPGTTAKDEQAITRVTDKIRDTQTPLPTAGASQSVPGCRTMFVRNQSSRLGVRPQQHWLHYTVSYNRPGWGDVLGVVALFNRASWGASSNFVIDGEGHCAYIVPIESKAWAQAGANRFAVSYEVIDYGNERSYLAPAGMAKLRSVMRIVSARTGIPMRRGKVTNCTPTRSGIVQHKDGGACAGGHHDIYPFPIESIVSQLVAGGKRPPSAHASRLCRELAHYRRMVAADRKDGGHRFDPRKRPRAVAVRNALAKHRPPGAPRGYSCSSRGVASRK